MSLIVLPFYRKFMSGDHAVRRDNDCPTVSPILWYDEHTRPTPGLHIHCQQNTVSLQCARRHRKRSQTNTHPTHLQNNAASRYTEIWRWNYKKANWVKFREISEKHLQILQFGKDVNKNYHKVCVNSSDAADELELANFDLFALFFALFLAFPSLSSLRSYLDKSTSSSSS